MAGYEETFARYYDALTADVDYRGHGAYLKSLAEQYGGRFRLVLDLACGTGSLAVELARLGAEVIGVDGSQEMLAQAMNKSFGLAPPILYLCQDMEELDLYGTVDTTLCTLDSLNHLPGKEALRRTLHRVWLFTEPGGLFLFDMNTPEKHIRRLNGSTYLRETEEVCCIWQNTLDPQDNSVGIELDFFVGEGGERYRRYSESFREYAYPKEEIQALLEAEGVRVSGGITPTVPLRQRRSGLSTSPGGNERWGNLSGPFRKTAWLSATPWIPPIWWGRWSGIIKQARWSPPPRGGFSLLPPSWVRCSRGQRIQLPCASRPAAPPVR